MVNFFLTPMNHLMWLQTKLFMHVHKGPHASPQGPHLIELHNGGVTWGLDLRNFGGSKDSFMNLTFQPKIGPNLKFGFSN